MLGIEPSRTELDSILSAGKTRKQLGELLRAVAQQYCSCCKHVLSAQHDDVNATSSAPTATKLWSRDFVAAIRRCHVEMKRVARHYGIDWKYLRSIECLDQQTVYGYVQMQWQRASERVSTLVDAQCLHAAAGSCQMQLSQASRATDNAFGVDEHVDSTYEEESSDVTNFGRDSCKAGILATAAALDDCLRAASKDLDLLCDSAVMDRPNVRRRLTSLLHEGIFNIIARFADCVHHLAFTVAQKVVNLDTATVDVFTAISASTGRSARPSVEDVASFGVRAVDHTGRLRDQDGVSLLALLRLLELISSHTVPVFIRDVHLAMADTDMAAAEPTGYEQLSKTHAIDTEKEGSHVVTDFDNDSDEDSDEEKSTDNSLSEDTDDPDGADDLQAHRDSPFHGSAPRGPDDGLELLSQLTSMILASFVRTQCTVPLVQLVRDGVRLPDSCATGATWSQPHALPQPTGVRDYAMNALLHCVNLHSAVSSTVPRKLPAVLQAASEAVTAAFRQEVDCMLQQPPQFTASRLGSGTAADCTKAPLSQEVAVQLSLELSFITSTLGPLYATEVSTGRAGRSQAS